MRTGRERPGSRESVQQRVGGESSEAESRQPRERLRSSAERGRGLSPSCWSGTGVAAPSQPTPCSSARGEAGGGACTQAPCGLCSLTRGHRRPSARCPQPCRTFPAPPPRQRDGRGDAALPPDTHHSGPDPIVGLHDGEPHGGDPLHRLSRLGDELGALRQPVLGGGEKGKKEAGVSAGSGRPRSLPAPASPASCRRPGQPGTYWGARPCPGHSPAPLGWDGRILPGPGPSRSSSPHRAPRPPGLPLGGPAKKKRERREASYLDVSSR